MYVAVLPGKSLVHIGEGEAAIDVPRGMYAPQLHQLEVQRDGRVRVLQVRLGLQTIHIHKLKVLMA